MATCVGATGLSYTRVRRYIALFYTCPVAGSCRTAGLHIFHLSEGIRLSYSSIKLFILIDITQIARLSKRFDLLWVAETGKAKMIRK